MEQSKFVDLNGKSTHVNDLLAYVLIYIPENEFGIHNTAYTVNEFVGLMRRVKDNPDAVQFLADMLEV